MHEQIAQLGNQLQLLESERESLVTSNQTLREKYEVQKQDLLETQECAQISHEEGQQVSICIIELVLLETTSSMQ